MKQLFICDSGTYSTYSKFEDIDKIAKGALGLYDLSTETLINGESEAAHDFAIVLGRGNGLSPRLIPEVDIKTLTVTKAESKEGNNFSASVVVPTAVVGTKYTIILTKLGKGVNERSNWTFDVVAKATTAASVAEALAKQINANSINTGFSASVSTATITITGSNNEPCGITLADGLSTVTPTVTEKGNKPVLYPEQIKELALACAAGKGFNYLAEGGKDLYPGFPETVSASGEGYLYTLRFAVPRMSGKQTDEVVYQIVHLFVTKNGNLASTLDSIFGLVEAEAPELE